jgi:hypothetical protein
LRTRPWIGLGIALVLLAPPAWSQKPSREIKKQAEAITADVLKNYLTFIASDALLGRDTPSPGLDAAAEFIAFHCRQFGLKPGGDSGTYFQKIALVSSGLDPARSKATLGGRILGVGTDFAPSVQGGGGTVSGPLVFVGHGWQITGQGIDPYAGADIKGKILVVGGTSLPSGVTFRTLRDPNSGALSPEAAAAKYGALGVVRLATDDDWPQIARGAGASRRGGFRMETGEGSEAASVPSIALSPAAAAELLDGESVPLDDAKAGKTVAATALSSGKTVAFTVEKRVDRRFTQNVVAIAEGSDPTLKAEYVAFGAHYDHIGAGEPDGSGRDVINNGADDDGSGTVSLLAIAQALSQGKRPKRSVILVWHCGEEKGLWGSEYFTDRPTVPIASIVTQLNIDMIGRSKSPGDTNPRNESLSGPDTIYVIGSRMLSTQLGQLVDGVNADYLKVGYDFKYDDPNDPNRFYFRSDHYNYAKHNIPIAFWFDGVHEDYHRVGDEVSKIDFVKMEKVARTVFATGLTIANLPARPVVDKKPDR